MENTALTWLRKTLYPPGNFRNISKSHHSFFFRTRTEAKGLEGETAVGHPTSASVQAQSERTQALLRQALGTPAPFCRGSSPPAQPRQRHAIPLQRRPPEPRFSSSSCTASHRSLFRTVVRSQHLAANAGHIPNSGLQGTSRPVLAAPGWPW